MYACPRDLCSSRTFGRPTRTHDFEAKTRTKMAEGQHPFPYTRAGLDAIGHALTASRLRTYMQAAAFDQERALAFYLWNARLSKALRYPLEIAEVSVRNRINYALCDRWGAHWPSSLDFEARAAQKTLQKLQEARDKAGRDTDRIVAAVSFGFWNALLGTRFVETLWRNRLDQQFPNLPADKPFEEKLQVLKATMEAARTVRNRISHLEPIFKSDPSKAHAEVIKLVGFACKATAGWTRHHSTFSTVLREGPDAVIRSGPVLRCGRKDFPVLDATTLLPEVIDCIRISPGGYVLTRLPDGPRRIDLASIGRWAVDSTTGGIIDFSDWTLRDVAAASTPLPSVNRKVGLTQLLTALGIPKRKPERFAVVTENGAPDEAPLAVLDLHDLIG